MLQTVFMVGALQLAKASFKQVRMWVILALLTKYKDYQTGLCVWSFNAPLVSPINPKHAQ